VNEHRRIHDVPEAVTNLHFVYMLMLCALSEAEPRLANCAFMGTREEVGPSIQAVMSNPLLKDPAIQKAAAALREHAQSPAAQVGESFLQDLFQAIQCPED
jgi:hypothetical protein